MVVATKQQLEEYQETTRGWQEVNLKIVDKKSQLVSLKHNSAQLKVLKAMDLQRKYGIPIMLLIYKARQEGISTFIEACIFQYANNRENWHACLVSVDDDSTNKVFRMCDTFQAEMPPDIKRRTIRASAKEIRYDAPHRSSILCQTAGKKVLGRGGTTKGVHATEVCFWANAKRQLVGLLQEVPDEPDTMQVLETTANGTGNEFSKRYWAAVKRLRGLYITNGAGKRVIDSNVLRGDLPIFLSWQDFPEYMTPLPKGCTDVPGMTDEMRDYVKEGLSMGVSLSPEQIYFALLKVQNKCGGDYDLFKQEYPRTAREAEIATGRMVFRASDLDEMEKNCKPPIANVEFYEDETKQVKYREVSKRHNCWSIWKWPVGSHSYVGFGDVAEGVLSDPNDDKSDPDRSVAGIMDRVWHEVPIVYYGRPDTIEFADQFILACKYYNYAWASPEMNSIGQSVLDAFKRANYPYIYSREKREDEIQREDSLKLGWKTTLATRKPMIADLVVAVKQHAFVVYDIRIIEELRVFIWNKQGKPTANKGEHDDCVIMFAGLVQMHQRCPYNDDLSLIEEDKEPIGVYVIAGQVESHDDLEDEDLDDVLYSVDEDYV